MRSHLFLISALPALVRAAILGHFDSSTCVDRSGFESCYETADTAFTTCVNTHCAGGNPGCVKDCNGDATCVKNKCPNLGLDCIKACSCVQNEDLIECAASSCWNEAYSCGYQNTVLDLLNVCVSVDLDAIPYWPAPDSAPGACSCNIGKMTNTQYKVSDQLNFCVDNSTNLNGLSSKEITEYAQACQCCFSSFFASTVWNICPTTQPALLGADNLDFIFKDFGSCGPYLQNYDCDSTLGFGAAVGNAMSEYYLPDDFPANGTETMSDKAGTLSSPTSATIVWTLVSDHMPRTIVAAQATGGAAKGSTNSASGRATTTDAKSTGTVNGQASASASALTSTSESSQVRVSWLVAGAFMFMLFVVM